MIIFTVGFLLILYGISSKKNFSVWLGMAFVLLIMGFQEGIPGDYEEYKLLFESSSTGAGHGDSIKDNEYSYLWIIHSLPKVMSFHVFVFISSLLQCLAMGKFINKYACKRYQYFGVLVIFFTFNIMLLQMKAMRQAYAVDTLLFAYLLLDKRKYFWSLLMIPIAYGFHNSSSIAIVAFIVLFVILILNDRGKNKNCGNKTSQDLPPAASKRKKNKKRGVKVSENKRSVLMASLAAGGLVIFYVLRFKLFASYIDPLIGSIEGFQYGFYLEQLEEEGFVAWWLMLYYVVMTFAVMLYYCTETDLFKKYLALMVIAGFYLTLLVNGFGNLQRITAYFIIFSIAVFPNTIEVIHKKYGRTIAIAFIVFNMLALMRVTVPYMFSYDTEAGTGFATYSFSFLY